MYSGIFFFRFWPPLFTNMSPCTSVPELSQAYFTISKKRISFLLKATQLFSIINKDINSISAQSCCQFLIYVDFNFVIPPFFKSWLLYNYYENTPKVFLWTIAWFYHFFCPVMQFFTLVMVLYLVIICSLIWSPIKYPIYGHFNIAIDHWLILSFIYSLVNVTNIIFLQLNN